MVLAKIIMARLICIWGKNIFAKHEIECISSVALFLMRIHSLDGVIMTSHNLLPYRLDVHNSSGDYLHYLVISCTSFPNPFLF
jgi:hypothetical protein